MNKFNQVTMSVLLVSLILLSYFSVGSFILNAKADSDCMKYGIPQAQVVGLRTYCGGVLNGTEMYIPLSVVVERYGEPK